MSIDELLDVVDENDNILFQQTKGECYKHSSRVRIANIIIIDPVTKKIIIQKRGKDVRWQPLHYCVSVAGHVAAGEDWDAAAKRELQEELGIDASLQFIGKLPFTCEFDRNFMLGVFTAEYPHSAVTPDEREVDQVFSMDKDEIRLLIASGEKLHNIFLPVINSVLKS